MLKRLGVGTFLMVALAAALLSLGSWCPPTPPPPSPSPTPTPTPTPTPVVESRPTSPVYTNLLLRQSQGKLIHPDGTPYRLVGAIPCWPTCDDPGCLKVDGKPVDYWWSLVSPQFMDAVKPKGVNAVHIRLGPVRAVDQCCGLQDVGGPYLEQSVSRLLEQHVRARGPEKMRIFALASDLWNPKFWARVHLVLRAAGELGYVVEVSVLDGWIIKHAIWGDFAMPWPAQDVATAAKLPPNESVKNWIKKVTFETCNYANVVYLIGNENDQIPNGWTFQTERAWRQLIRDGEQQPGCVDAAGKPNVVHMVGSNTRDLEGGYDYYAVHATETDSPLAGRPAWINEYNPAVSTATFKAMCDKALAEGSACWYWRSDGSDADQDASLNSILGPVETGCPAPKPNRDRLSFAFNCDASNNCDTTPLNEGDLTYCQAIGMGEYNGQPRATCPVRPECAPDSPPGAICHSRLACEQFDIGNAAPVFSSDGSWRYVDAGHFRVKVDGGTYLQACNVEGTRCSRVALH